jgi:hypothetical protein
LNLIKNKGLFVKKMKLITWLFITFVIGSTLVAAQQKGDYKSDVIGVNEAQLSSNHWLKNLSEAPLMSPMQVAQFNDKVINNDANVVNPLAMAEQLTKTELLAKIDQISSLPTSDRFYADGSKLNESSYRGYLSSVNKTNVAAMNPVKFGLVVKRSVLRKFPTMHRVFNEGMDTDLDRFQESGVFPGEAVAVLHQSSDKLWYLVQAYNYVAWVPKKAIALASKETINKFVGAKHFLLVTGSKVYTAYTPENKKVSQIQLDMGVRLPLVDFNNVPSRLYGQNPFASYVVQLPTQNEDGNLELAMALVGRSQDVSTDYLKVTKQNIVKQAFKFLGERYGWGHDYNGRDCTGFVGEVYKSFGFVMPRNSGQQGHGKYGENTRFTKKSTRTEKLAVIKTLAVGDLIYIPGHVMMYLGEENGEPYVIHDVKGLAYLDQQGELYRGTLNGVSVTPLLPLRLSKTTTYVDRIYNIKRIAVTKNNSEKQEVVQ